MLAWLVPSLFLYIYAIVGGIEFALPSLRLATTDPHDQAVINRWFSPVWEVTNVFLVMAITGFAAVFPLVLPLLTPGLRWWLLITGLLLGLRALVVLVVFYGGAKHWLNDLLLAIISLIIPAALAQVLANLILPHPSWQQGAVLALVCIFTSLALGASFLLAIRPQGPYRRVALLSLAALAIVSLPLYRISSLVPVARLITGSALLGLAVISAWRRRYVPIITTIVMITLVFIRVLARQWPYVIYPSVSYGQVEGGAAIHHVILVGMLIGTIIAVPGLIALVIILAQNFMKGEAPT